MARILGIRKSYDWHDTSRLRQVLHCSKRDAAPHNYQLSRKLLIIVIHKLAASMFQNWLNLFTLKRDFIPYLIVSTTNIALLINEQIRMIIIGRAFYKIDWLFDWSSPPSLTTNTRTRMRVWFPFQPPTKQQPEVLNRCLFCGHTKCISLLLPKSAAPLHTLHTNAGLVLYGMVRYVWYYY